MATEFIEIIMHLSWSLEVCWIVIEVAWMRSVVKYVEICIHSTIWIRIRIFLIFKICAILLELIIPNVFFIILSKE